MNHHSGSLSNKIPIPKMMIGTVQFGVPYGISNQKGQPSIKEVMKIIEYAHESGIYEYDTAAVYGDSESILGSVFKELGISKHVSIITKIEPLIKEVRESEEKSRKVILTSLDHSLKRLKLDHITGVLFHREEDAIHLDILHRQKDLGKCKWIGVSCNHNPETVKKLVVPGRLDALQLPANLMDQRHINDEVIVKANDNKVLIFIRSAFMQGILTMKNDKIPQTLSALKPLHQRYETLAKKADMSLKELALRTIISLGVTNVVVGNESLAQLKENISIFERGPLSEELMEAVKQNYKELASSLITPSLWSTMFQPRKEQNHD